MLHWAASGITRVRHALGATGTRLATLPELLTAHPALVTASYPRGRSAVAYIRSRPEKPPTVDRHTQQRSRPILVRH